MDERRSSAQARKLLGKFQDYVCILDVHHHFIYVEAYCHAINSNGEKAIFGNRSYITFVAQLADPAALTRETMFA